MSETWGGVFPRLGRVGLGNMLFPWARAVILSETSDTPFLAPHWRRIQSGLNRRREGDRRNYHAQLHQPGVQQFLRERVRLIRSEVIDEGAAEQIAPTRSMVVVTSGIGGGFAGMEPWRAVLHDSFTALIRRPLEALPTYAAVHVRLGDFMAAPDDAHVSTGNQSTPMSWFTEAILGVQRAMPSLKVWIVSDGSDVQLSPLLRMNGVARAPRRGAVADLQMLFAARVLIGSNSTFSAWGAFLGESLTFFRPGENIYLKERQRVFELPGADAVAETLQGIR